MPFDFAHILQLKIHDNEVPDFNTYIEAGLNLIQFAQDIEQQIISCKIQKYHTEKHDSASDMHRLSFAKHIEFSEQLNQPAGWDTIRKTLCIKNFKIMESLCKYVQVELPAQRCQDIKELITTFLDKLHFSTDDFFNLSKKLADEDTPASIVALQAIYEFFNNEAMKDSKKIWRQALNPQFAKNINITPYFHLMRSLISYISDPELKTECGKLWMLFQNEYYDYRRQSSLSVLYQNHPIYQLHNSQEGSKSSDQSSSFVGRLKSFVSK